VDKKQSSEIPLTGIFPERLAQARKARGWSQSDLARAVWGETVDKRGYTVARHRDRVSAYEKGATVPTEQSLRELAAGLGVSAENLAPDVLAERAFSGGAPTIDIRVVDGGVFLRVNVLTDMVTASKVVAVLDGKIR